MKTHRQFMKAVLTILPVLAQGTALTYQGRLNDDGNATSGTNNHATVPATLRRSFIA